MEVEFDYSKTPGRMLFDRGSQPNEGPMVSVITPFYNAGEHFMETVNCLLNQTFPYFEWIIVNDGSTNQEDVGLLTRVAESDSRIIIYHKENGGPSAARNLAIQNTSTEIIIPLDADDLIEPSYIECIYWSLYTHPEASYSYTDSVGFHGEEYLWKQPFSARKMKTENLLTYAAGFRKKDLLEVGLQSEQQKYLYEDWHLWLKLLEKGKIGVHQNWYGFWYRRTDKGVMSQVRKSEELEKQAHKLIADVAVKVDENVSMIEYPRVRNLPELSFSKTTVWEWDRKPVSNPAKIKVLLLLPHMVMGGADLFNLDIVSRIDKDKFEVSIITTNPTESTWRQRFEEHVHDLFELPTFLDVEQWAAFIHYFIRSRSVDIVMVTNSYFGYYMMPWLRMEFPNLVILDYVHSETWYWRSGGYARNSAALQEFIDKSYVCTNNLREVMIDRLKKKADAVETVYIGVDEEQYDPESTPAGMIKRNLGIAQDRKIVLFPCRIDIEKRPFLMLEIASRLAKQIDNVAFVVVGDGPNLQELKETIRKKGLEKVVYCVGRQKDLRPYYRDSSATLVCSLKEGLSLTSYESLSMGVPVVSSDVGGQKELIDQQVGYILPLLQDESTDLDNREYSVQEIDNYTSALTSLLNLSEKERQELSEACRNRIRQGFSKGQMIDRLEQEFLDWVSGKGKAQREFVASAVQNLPFFVEDFMTLYHEYLRKDMEADEIWRAKLYLQEQLQQTERSRDEIFDSRYMNNDLAIQELQHIYSMRTWRIVEKYRRFMDGRSGRALSKLRSFVLRR